VIILLSSATAQTTQWRVVWDKNAAIDSVEYYRVFRNIGSAPGLSDEIGTVPQPTNINQDSVVYLDQNIESGVHYFYRVQAIDSLQRSSPLSPSADAAIPIILINDHLTLASNSIISFSLNDQQYVNDPDHSFNQLDWAVTGGTDISININSSNTITIETPEDTTIEETFQFSVVDPDSFYDVKSVTISLTRINSQPQIITSPVTSTIYNDLYQYEVIASDPDGDALTFSLTQAPAFLNITSTSDTSALISGTPSASDLGSHQVRLIVEDDYGGFDTQNYVLTVHDTTDGENFHQSIQISFLQSGIVQIEWQTIEPSRDYIEYGMDDYYGNSTSQEIDLNSEHEQQITGLVGNTTYHFQLVSENSSGIIYRSADSVFTTLPDQVEEQAVKAYPIPYNVNTQTGLGGINFELPSSSEYYSLYIYTILGDLVYAASDLTGTYLWNVTNDAGREINAGLYLYVVKKDNGDHVSTGKLIIVR
jgi:hypothetical protein